MDKLQKGMNYAKDFTKKPKVSGYSSKDSVNNAPGVINVTDKTTVDTSAKSAVPNKKV